MKHILWSDQPLVIRDPDANLPRAEYAMWEKTVYPIGNGRLGGTAFGNPERERIQFNQDSLWVGNEDNTGAYQPFGDVMVAFDHADASAYRRELDLDRAVQTISYQSGGIRFRREYLASHPAQVMVLRFSASQSRALSGTVSLENIHDIPIVVDGDDLVMRGDTADFWYWRMQLENPKRLIADRAYASETIIALDFEARLRILHQGGTVQATDHAFVFDQVDELILLLAADTNYVADRSVGWRGEHPHQRVCHVLDQAAVRSWDDLVSEHVADHQSVFGALDVSLACMEASDDEAATTETRLLAYRERFAKQQPVVDHGLEVLLYQYARYLMIGSSRSGHGALPANLQGIWCINKKPSWRCDFHTDINIQMNYWFVDGANISECFLPFAHWIDSIRDVRKEETRRVLGVERGWLMRSENGIFGGSTWHIQKGDSAWLCQNLWDHYLFTCDRDYLRRYAYPVMKEISEFWLDHLKPLPDGRLVAPDGRSPEHGPVGVDGVTYDQQLCAELFDNTIAAARTLGNDESFCRTLEAKRSRLLAPAIGKWGQLQEWLEDLDDPTDDHRHINHLIGLYPGSQIDPEATPERSNAARISLEARRDHGQGHPAWSRVWKACMFARLRDGESAYTELRQTLAEHIYPNLWAVHPPFQIDANFGFAAAVNEMLIQSNVRQQIVADNEYEEIAVIQLLPALPLAWSTGHVKGIRARGGYALDIAWKAGKLFKASLHALPQALKRCELCYDGRRETLSVKPGETIEWGSINKEIE